MDDNLQATTRESRNKSGKNKSSSSTKNLFEGTFESKAV